MAARISVSVAQSHAAGSFPRAAGLSVRCNFAACSIYAARDRAFWIHNFFLVHDQFFVLQLERDCDNLDF
jgi:hypothetical protein